MTDISKRVLIVDDDQGRYVDIENMMSAYPHVEVRYARTSIEAVSVLSEWRENGHRADLISIDDNYYGNGELFSEVSEVLYDYLDTASVEDGVNYIPHTVFIHSKDPNDARKHKNFEKWSNILVTDTFEFEAMYDSCALMMNDNKRERYRVKNIPFDFTEFRVFCNENLGTDFITDKAIFKYKYQSEYSEDALSLSSVIDLFNKGADGFSSILTKYEPCNDFIDRTSLDWEGKRDQAVPFMLSTGGDVSGRMACNAADIKTIKQQYPNDPIILVLECFNPEDAPLFNDVHGLIYTGEGHEHMKQIADNMGISALIAVDYDDVMRRADVSFENGVFQHKSYEYDETYDGGRKLVTQVLYAGDFISIVMEHYTSYGADGKESGVTGQLIPSKLEPMALWHNHEYDFIKNSFYQECQNILDTSDAVQIKANADNAAQVHKSFDNGAEGIGLVRTEHMINSIDDLAALKTVLLTDEIADKADALAHIKCRQKSQIAEIFAVAACYDYGRAVTIRLLDAPIDQFYDEKTQQLITQKYGQDNLKGQALADHVEGLYRIQIEAIFEAANDAGYPYDVEILVPYISGADDMQKIRSLCDDVASGRGYKLGGMIENMNAAADSANIAEVSDFLSIGTNDLMTSVMGNIKRHDVDAINNWMIENKLYGVNPFVAMTEPLNAVLQSVVSEVRKIKPDIYVSACGQQMAEDVQAAKHASNIGLNAISVPASYIQEVTVRNAFYSACVDKDTIVSQARVRSAQDVAQPNQSL
tara:strand:- start:312919 stop:315195 length:2277 start_codon:yes stop_codon:yes gene_type:complete